MPPITDEWRSHFPVGVYIATETAQFRNTGNTTATSAVDPNIQAHWNRLLNHPEQGLRTNGMNYVFPAAAQVYAWEDAAGISSYIDTTNPMTKTYMGIGGKTTLSTTPPTGTNDWYTRDPANQTYADALVLAAPIVANFQDHPSILGYHFGDDVTVLNQGQSTVNLALAVQDLDPYGRPVINTVTDPDVWALPGAERLKLVSFYRYPFGKTRNGNVALEGDMHRNTFENEPGMPAFADYVDVIRRRVAALPAACEGRFHLILQHHGTVDSGASIRPVTPDEHRLLFWVSVGEGAKGLWWFPWDGSTDAATSLAGNSWGIGDIHEVASLQVAAELAYRLKPEIRQALLRCNRVTDKFAASGGGSTGYPTNYANAYVSTLYDAGRDEYYCVVCNHNNSSTPQNVTISSATLTGKLINLETGTEYRLPATVSLKKLDGTIFRYDPDYGVPYWEPDFGLGTTATESTDLNWARHWANPTGTAYRDSASIKTHPRVVDVPSGADLQTLINSGPDYSTYRLAAGGVYEGTVRIVGKQGIHIVSANPANKAILRRLEIFGDEVAIDYDKQGGINIVMGDKNDPKYAQAINAFYNPRRDFLVRDIAFTADATPWLYYTWEWDPRTSRWIHNHRAYNMPIWIRTIRDMLVEGCTFTGYKNGADPPEPATPTDTPAPAQAGTSQYHGGLLSGNAGMVNICMRNCTGTAEGSATTDQRYPLLFFVDGGRGCAVVNNRGINRFNTGVLFLGNDDFTGDFRNHNDGGKGIRENDEVRTARYNYAYGNEFDQGGTTVAATGRNIGVYNNTHHGTSSSFALISGRCSRVWPLGHRYIHYGSSVKGNHSDGPVTNFVEVAVNDAGGCGRDLNSDGIPDTEADNFPFRGFIGQTAVQDNTCGGAVAFWLRRQQNPVPIITMDGPDVVTNNTDSNGTRDGV